MGRKGQERTLPEYYHRGVVAHLIGFDLPVVLDIEMLAPGEGEISAAKRLLERLMERYERFFDAVVGDALFWEAPLFELCRKHDKRLLAVLKDNNPALLADAQALLQGEPDLSRKDSELHIQYWDREGFTSGAVDAPVRVLRTLETRNKRERIAGRWVQSQPNPHPAELFPSLQPQARSPADSRHARQRGPPAPSGHSSLGSRRHPLVSPPGPGAGAPVRSGKSPPPSCAPGFFFARSAWTDPHAPQAKKVDFRPPQCLAKMPANLSSTPQLPKINANKPFPTIHTSNKT